MRGGGVAYLNVDAHRGWGVGHGEQSFCTVHFLGLQLRVMTGAARIAAVNGAVLLPALAVPDGPRPGRVICGPPVIPPGPGASGADFVRQTMQDLYDFFEPHVAADPVEWQDVRFLHRWRVPGSAAASPEADPAGWVAALERHLEAGARIRLNASRCVPLGTGPDTTLVDAHSLRGFRPPAGAPDLLAALAARDGLNGAWLSDRCAGPVIHAQATTFLATLLMHGLVRACTDN
jgi:hypothetical protein